MKVFKKANIIKGTGELLKKGGEEVSKKITWWSNEKSFDKVSRKFSHKKFRHNR